MEQLGKRLTNWASILEDKTRAQAERTAQMPFIVPHVALMPDAHASEGRPGLIPGSMGTRSYVVTGKGNRLALNSAPHGAGRAFSRSAARKTFSRADLDAAMAGIEWRHTDAFLDEIPAACKDVDQVMADAVDLVDVRHTLRQIVNVKGD
jgi:tRNA-splicing ligase RtcB